MNTTRDRLKSKSVPRPIRPVDLPGGEKVHVRDLSVADLRRADARAGDGSADERKIRTVLVLCATALTEADGTRVFPDVTDDDIESVAELSTSQLEAIAAAAVPSKADAKK